MCNIVQVILVLLGTVAFLIFVFVDASQLYYTRIQERYTPSGHTKTLPYICKYFLLHGAYTPSSIVCFLF